MEARLGFLEKKVKELEEENKNTKSDTLVEVKAQLESWLHNTLTISCISEEIHRRYKLTKEDIEENGREHRKLEKTIAELKEILESNVSDTLKLKNSFKDLTIDLKSKAFAKDLQNLERQLVEKSSWDFVYNLSNQLKFYTRIEENEQRKKDLIEFKSEVGLNYFAKEDAKTLMKNLETRFISYTKKYVTSNKLEKIIGEQEKKINACFSKSELNTKKIDSLQNYTSEEFYKIHKDSYDNAKLHQFEKLQKDIHSKLEKGDFDKVMKEYMPKISEFNKEFNNIKHNFEMQESAIGRLDEIILEKASKMEIILFKESLSDLAVSKHLSKINDLYKKSSDIQNQIVNLESDFSDKIKSVLETAPSRLALETEIRVILDTINDLESKLSSKADSSEILEKLEKKSSWEDFSHLAESIESVHMQTKLLASQVKYFLTTTKNTTIRAASQSRITKKLADVIMASKPTLEETPSSHIRTFIKFPQTLETAGRSRVPTPNKKSVSPIHITNM